MRNNINIIKNKNKKNKFQEKSFGKSSNIDDWEISNLVLLENFKYA